MTPFEIVLVAALTVITPLAVLCGWHFGRAFQAGVELTRLRIEARDSTQPLPGEPDDAYRCRINAHVRRPWR